MSFSCKVDLRKNCQPATLRGWSVRPWSQRIDPAAVRLARTVLAGDTTTFDEIRSPDSHTSLCDRVPFTRRLDPPRKNSRKLAKIAQEPLSYHVVTANRIHGWSTRRAVASQPSSSQPPSPPTTPITRSTYVGTRSCALYRHHQSVIWRYFCDSKQRVNGSPIQFKKVEEKHMTFHSYIPFNKGAFVIVIFKIINN